MDADITPLDKIVAVNQSFCTLKMVDDTHSKGVLGCGIVDHFNLHYQVDLEIGTLSKAFGVMGGMVTSSAKLIKFLRQKLHPFLFFSPATSDENLAQAIPTFENVEK